MKDSNGRDLIVLCEIYTRKTVGIALFYIYSWFDNDLMELIYG